MAAAEVPDLEEMTHRLVAHKVVPVVLMGDSVVADPFAEGADYEAVGCDVCNMPLQDCLVHPDCPGPRKPECNEEGEQSP